MSVFYLDMTSREGGEHGGVDPKQVYELSKMSSDELFEILENVVEENNNDVEDDELDHDFDDDDSIADPDFCLEDPINNCNAVAQSSTLQLSTSKESKMREPQIDFSVATNPSTPTLEKSSACQNLKRGLMFLSLTEVVS